MKNNDGWIKLHRSLLTWEWWSDHNTTRLFLTCLLKANHKEAKYRGTIVPRGSFLTSLELLSKESGLSVRQVRTSLNHLKSTCEVTCEATRKGTKLSICNYETYQSSELPSDTLGDTKDVSQATNNRHTTDTRPTSNKNDNNKKKEKKILYTEGDISIANKFLEGIKLNHPTRTNLHNPNIGQWADTVRLLRAVDNYEVDYIEKVLNHAIHDSFWKDNLLALPSLRSKSKNGCTKFENIVTNMNKSQPQVESDPFDFMN